MREIHEVFYEKILLFRELCSNSNFEACSNTSTDMITTAIMLDYQDGVFVAEVLEAIFNQLNTLSRQFDFEDKEHDILVRSLSDNLTVIAKTFGNDDKNKLYQALSNIRFVATKLQYACYQTKEVKRQERFNPFKQL